MFAAALAAMSPEAKLDPRISALAVMDLESGKELKYRELIKHPKLGEIWNGSSTRHAILSTSTSQLEQALAIACSLKPATHQAKKLSQRKLPRAMFAAALADMSPEAELYPRMAALVIMDLESGKELKYRELLKHPKLGEIWNGSSSNEFDRLTQGKTGRVKGTDTIDFIHYDEIPQDRRKDVTYASFALCESVIFIAG